MSHGVITATGRALFTIKKAGFPFQWKRWGSGFLGNFKDEF